MRYGYHEIEEFILDYFFDMSLLQEFRNLIGKKVTYSRCGGGNGSILLITFCCMEDNRPDIVSYNLWAWWYWILLCNGEKCADACDDVTAIVGKAVLEVKKLEGQTVVNVFTDIYANLFIEFTGNYSISIYHEISKSNEEDNLKWELCNFKTNKTYYPTSDDSIRCIIER